MDSILRIFEAVIGVLAGFADSALTCSGPECDNED